MASKAVASAELPSAMLSSAVACDRSPSAIASSPSASDCSPIEIAPSMAMGGKPNELYGQVRDGAADIVWTLLGYTPGVFPRSEVFELPLVHAGSATDTTIALNASLEINICITRLNHQIISRT